MTVTTFLNYKEYQTEGMTTQFCIPFLLLERGDLNVFIDNELITSGYTVTGLGNPYSEIVFEDAPVGLLLLQRSITLLRETDYQENGDLLAETVNRDFDRLYLSMQGFAQDITKTLRVQDAIGVQELPLAPERANKTLSFDSQGQPVLTTTATGSAAELAQKLIDARDENKGSGLVGYNQALRYPTRTIGNALNTLTDRFDHFEGNGVPLFSVFWWPSRTSIPNGYVVADGQELSQAIFPDAALGIQQSKVPTVQELEWQMDPLKRGSYVANSSQGKFRVPDYNGKSVDSIGALFLRGNSGIVNNGEIQLDSIQNITGALGYSRNITADSSGAFKATPSGSATGSGATANQTNLYDFDASRVVRTSNETRPINISGCWVIKLFAAITNAGNADIQQLITENANLAARLSILESYQQAKRFTIIYPNGGTEDNPANVETGKRYIMENPFPNEHVICEAEIFINGMWANPWFIYDAGSSSGMGTVASYIIDQDQIIIQTGNGAVMVRSILGGGGHGYTGANVAAAPCRVKVWRVI